MAKKSLSHEQVKPNENFEVNAKQVLEIFKTPLFSWVWGFRKITVKLLKIIIKPIIIAHSKVDMGYLNYV
jgi:hypothetical protein